jgi:hypothetical protein
MAVIDGYALDEVVFGPQYGPTPLYGYEPDPPVPNSGAYRMRARDTTLAAVVYWNSDQVDVLGIDYGGPGPLTDVVVKEKS